MTKLKSNPGTNKTKGYSRNQTYLRKMTKQNMLGLMEDN